MPLKICTIGCGGHSSSVHGPSYLKYKKEHPDTVFAACCDLNAENAEKYREKFGFERAYTDFTEMLKKEKPDGVCLIVPEWVICKTAIAVMKLGYSILLEKPPGLNRTETMSMIEAAEEMGVINQVAFNRRSMPLINKLREEVRANAPDGVQNMFYEFYRYDRREDHFETTAIHGIDAAKHVMGCDYKEVRFTYNEYPELGRNVANMLLECTFENGATARLNFCPVTGVVLERMCITAKDHTFFLSTPIWNGIDSPGEFSHVHAGELVKRVSGEELTETQDMYLTNGFYDENRSFFENLKNGTKSENDIKSTLQSVEIAEAIKNRAAIWTA